MSIVTRMVLIRRRITYSSPNRRTHFKSVGLHPGEQETLSYPKHDMDVFFLQVNVDSTTVSHNYYSLEDTAPDLYIHMFHFRAEVYTCVSSELTQSNSCNSRRSCCWSVIRKHKGWGRHFPSPSPWACDKPGGGGSQHMLLKSILLELQHSFSSLIEHSDWRG